METLFENTYTRDRETVKEVYAYGFFRRPRMIVMYVLMALLFVHGILQLVIHRDFFTVFLPLLFVGLVIIRYFRTVNLVLQRDQEVSGGDLTVTICATEHGLFMKHAGETSSEISLTHMKNYVTTKHCIMIHSESKLSYIFRRDGFTKGTEQEFYKFLLSKGISRGR